MCDDGTVVVLGDEPAAIGMSRRRFMRNVGLAGAGGLLLGEMGWPQAARASGIDGSPAWSMAMHIHTSFSEQAGSMDSHLYQASTTGVNVIWWTDHDQRMLEAHYRQVVHFTSLTQESTDGTPWLWQQKTAGSLASSSGGVVQSPASPNDPVGGSLAVGARSASTRMASLGFYAESHPAGWNYHCNLYGQTLTIDVLPTSVDAHGYLELLISSSYHQARAGVASGTYSLSYRIGGPGSAGTRVANGRQGIIYLPFLPGQWNTLSITPTDDITALWPDMQVNDFASFGLTLSAVSLGSPASGNFDYLQFARQYNTGQVPIQTQQQMMSAYAVTYPNVTQYQGLEISGFGSTHINWFGGTPVLADYTGVTSQNYQAFLRQQVAVIHANGGVASYNHPFGSNAGPLLSLANQDSKVSQVAAARLADNLLDCDIMEVGYPLRGGCDLAHHLALWDVLSRNGRFTTGNGVSDDHFGENWLRPQNNWYTSVWAPTDGEADLVTALSAGRAWTGSLSRFRGMLDLVADAACPMGSVSVSQVAQRQLQVIAIGVPTGGSVQVIRGVVDYAGSTPNSSLYASYPASALSNGSITLGVDTSSSCFLRTQVLDSTGAVIAVSNPIWLLLAAPPGGIPAARACSYTGLGLSRTRP